MSLVPVPSEQRQPETTCANCDAPLVADQRYCLSCGRPVSPVRLAFLDVLAPAAPPPPPAGTLPAAWAPGGFELTPTGYVPVQQQGAAGWLRRNSGLLGLLIVLALFLLAGLLVGHWVSQSKTPANQTVKIEGLSGLGAVGAGTGTGASSSTPASGSSAPAAKASAAASKKEEEVGKHETAKEKAPPAAPKAVSKAKVQKLTQSTGKKHQEEINALGAQPIETG
jgi:hypothetical protein